MADSPASASNNLPDDPLGIQYPLGLSSIRGGHWLQPQYIEPLGMRPLAGFTGWNEWLQRQPMDDFSLGSWQDQAQQITSTAAVPPQGSQNPLPSPLQTNGSQGLGSRQMGNIGSTTPPNHLQKVPDPAKSDRPFPPETQGIKGKKNIQEKSETVPPNQDFQANINGPKIQLTAESNPDLLMNSRGDLPAPPQDFSLTKNPAKNVDVQRNISEESGNTKNRNLQSDQQTPNLQKASEGAAEPSGKAIGDRPSTSEPTQENSNLNLQSQPQSERAQETSQINGDPPDLQAKSVQNEGQFTTTEKVSDRSILPSQSIEQTNHSDNPSENKASKIQQNPDKNSDSSMEVVGDHSHISKSEVNNHHDKIQLKGIKDDQAIANNLEIPETSEPNRFQPQEKETKLSPGSKGVAGDSDLPLTVETKPQNQNPSSNPNAPEIQRKIEPRANPLIENISDLPTTSQLDESTQNQDLQSTSNTPTQEPNSLSNRSISEAQTMGESHPREIIQKSSDRAIDSDPQNAVSNLQSNLEIDNQNQNISSIPKIPEVQEKPNPNVKVLGKKNSDSSVTSEAKITQQNQNIPSTQHQHQAVNQTPKIQKKSETPVDLPMKSMGDHSVSPTLENSDPKLQSKLEFDGNSLVENTSNRSLPSEPVIKQQNQKTPGVNPTPKVQGKLENSNPNFQSKSESKDPNQSLPPNNNIAEPQTRLDSNAHPFTDKISDRPSTSNLAANPSTLNPQGINNNPAVHKPSELINQNPDLQLKSEIKNQNTSSNTNFPEIQNHSEPDSHSEVEQISDRSPHFKSEAVNKNQTIQPQSNTFNSDQQSRLNIDISDSQEKSGLNIDSTIKKTSDHAITPKKKNGEISNIQAQSESINQKLASQPNSSPSEVQSKADLNLKLPMEKVSDRPITSKENSKENNVNIQLGNGVPKIQGKLEERENSSIERVSNRSIDANNSKPEETPKAQNIQSKLDPITPDPNLQLSPNIPDLQGKSESYADPKVENSSDHSIGSESENSIADLQLRSENNHQNIGLNSNISEVNKMESRADLTSLGEVFDPSMTSDSEVPNDIQDSQLKQNQDLFIVNQSPEIQGKLEPDAEPQPPEVGDRPIISEIASQSSTPKIQPKSETPNLKQNLQLNINIPEDSEPPKQNTDLPIEPKKISDHPINSGTIVNEKNQTIQPLESLETQAIEGLPGIQHQSKPNDQQLKNTISPPPIQKKSEIINKNHQSYHSQPNANIPEIQSQKNQSQIESPTNSLVEEIGNETILSRKENKIQDFNIQADDNTPEIQGDLEQNTQLFIGKKQGTDQSSSSTPTVTEGTQNIQSVNDNPKLQVQRESDHFQSKIQSNNLIDSDSVESKSVNQNLDIQLKPEIQSQDQDKNSLSHHNIPESQSQLSSNVTPFGETVSDRPLPSQKNTIKNPQNTELIQNQDLRIISNPPKIQTSLEVDPKLAPEEATNQGQIPAKKGQTNQLDLESNQNTPNIQTKQGKNVDSSIEKAHDLPTSQNFENTDHNHSRQSPLNPVTQQQNNLAAENIPNVQAQQELNSSSIIEKSSDRPRDSKSKKVTDGLDIQSQQETIADTINLNKENKVHRSISDIQAKPEENTSLFIKSDEVGDPSSILEPIKEQQNNSLKLDAINQHQSPESNLNNLTVSADSSQKEIISRSPTDTNLDDAQQTEKSQRNTTDQTVKEQSSSVLGNISTLENLQVLGDLSRVQNKNLSNLIQRKESNPILTKNPPSISQDQSQPPSNPPTKFSPKSPEKQRQIADISTVKPYGDRSLIQGNLFNYLSVPKNAQRAIVQRMPTGLNSNQHSRKSQQNYSKESINQTAGNAQINPLQNWSSIEDLVNSLPPGSASSPPTLQQKSQDSESFAAIANGEELIFTPQGFQKQSSPPQNSSLRSSPPQKKKTPKKTTKSLQSKINNSEGDSSFIQRTPDQNQGISGNTPTINLKSVVSQNSIPTTPESTNQQQDKKQSEHMFEILAQEVYLLVKQRLVLDQERHGGASGRMPW